MVRRTYMFIYLRSAYLFAEYYLPSCQIIARAFFGFWANLVLYGRLLINEATWQLGGYGFGQVLTKHIFFQ